LSRHRRSPCAVVNMSHVYSNTVLVRSQ
jgi:hypothetical protein